MVYLVIKELSTVAEDVIMVTSSLMKDMQPKSELTYRANAIRALCKIIDVSKYALVFFVTFYRYTHNLLLFIHCLVSII